MDARRSVKTLPLKIRYLLTGALNTAAGYLLFAAVYLLAGRWLPYALVLVASHLLAVTFSFATHRGWVFGASGGHVLVEWARFQTAYLGLLVLGLAANAALLRWVTSSVWVAQAAAMTLGVIVAWFVHRHWVFRRDG